MNSFKMAKVFNLVPKWQNFAKSGHTARLELLAQLVWSNVKVFCFVDFQVSGKTSAPEKPIRKKLPAEVLKEENEEGEGGGGQLLETATEF